MTLLPQIPGSQQSPTDSLSEKDSVPNSETKLPGSSSSGTTAC